MTRFLTDITSIYWWISVVVVGILIHIFGTLISHKLDVPLSKVSTWWRDRSQQRTLEAEQAIAELKSSQHEQVMMAIKIVNEKVSLIIASILGYALLLMGGGFFGVGD